MIQIIQIIIQIVIIIIIVMETLLNGYSGYIQLQISLKYGNLQLAT